MIYATGHERNCDFGILAYGADFLKSPGSRVWETEEDAADFLARNGHKGYAVYALLADWDDVDTEKVVGQAYRTLCVNARIFYKCLPSTDITPIEYTPPPVDEREEGLEVLAFHRGKWRHVRWSEHGWSLGRGGAFIHDATRKFAPLPAVPEGEPDFYAYKD